MKLIIKLFMLSAFVVGNSFNAFSQDTQCEIPAEQIPQATPEQSEEAKAHRTDEEKAEEVEVRKFVDSFMKEMDDKKDINKVSDKFLFDNFKERLMKKNNWLEALSEEFSKELTDDERLKGDTEVINLIRLTTLSMYGNNVDFDSGELETIEGLKKIFPKSIFDIAENNRFLASIIKKEFTPKNDDEDVPDPTIENVVELRQLIDDFRSINDELRKYIDAQNSIWHETKEKRMKESNKTSDYYHAKPCEGEACEGLQEKQIIYHVDSFPFCILVVNEFGSYKVLSIYMRMD
jgi:hypothetical protein